MSTHDPYLQIYQIPAAKALVGAALIQYFLYSVIYIIEGFKLQEFDEGSKPKATKKKGETNGATQQPQPDQEEQNNQKPADLKEIALEEENNEESSQNRPSTIAEPTKVNDSMKLDEDEDTSFEMPFLMMVPKHYQKSTIWFMVALGICAVRAPNPVTISVAYLQVLFRLLQLIGAILHKRRVSQIGYILASICTVILFFSAMIRGASVEVLPNE